MLTVDHDLHGLVTVRLVDPPPAAAAAVARQLGSTGGPASGEADLEVRFVESVPRNGAMRLIGLEEMAFTDDRFLLLRRTPDGVAVAAVPLDTLGRACEIECERGITTVPMLVPLLNLVMLSKGVLPLHASAFTHRGIGVAAAGWRKSGKTETLLGFMAHGALAVADEWCYVTADGSMFGVPEPVRLQDWHFEQLPQHRAAVTAQQRSRMGVLRAVDRVGAAARRASARGVPGASALGRSLRSAQDRRHVDIHPDALFGAERWVGHGHLDRAFLLLNSEDTVVRVEAMSGQEVAERMVFAHQHHRLSIIGANLAARFAFPQRVSEAVAGAEERERELLHAALDDLPCFAVQHPYPVPIDATFQAMEAHVC
ncbi:MAG: hypothetical protein ACOYXM_10790 [Actinomycetota bacterium]